MILEVDNYQGLETLEIDILEATKGKTEYILNKAFASYEGIRHESEIMSNKWQMGDIYVVFTKKKIKRNTPSSNGIVRD